MKKQAILAILALLMLLGVGWVVVRKIGGQRVVINDVPDVATSTIANAMWREHSDEELGIVISYPEEFLKTPFAIRPALTGKIFYANFEFPSGAFLSVSSLTKDYSAEKDGNWGKGLGYTQQGEKYFLKHVRGKLTAVSPREFLAVNNNERAIVLYKDDFSKETQEMFYAPNMLVIVNLPNDSFPGLGFELSQNESKYPITQEEMDVVKKMVTSLVFLK